MHKNYIFYDQFRDGQNIFIQQMIYSLNENTSTICCNPFLMRLQCSFIQKKVFIVPFFIAVKETQNYYV